MQHNNSIMPTYELVYQEKLDYQQLIRLFSTSYFQHHKDDMQHFSQFQAQTMQGIAAGWSSISNRLEIYNPLTRKLYTTTVFKIYMNSTTLNHILISYGKGYILHLPTITPDTADSHYVVQLLDDTNTNIPMTMIHSFIMSSNSSIKLNLPHQWMVHDAKFQYTIGRIMYQGHLHCEDNNKW